MSHFYAMVQHSTQRFSDHIALIEGDTRWTYQDFLTRIDHAANGFHAQGITPGERVGLMLLNQKELLVAFFALRKMGAIPVPINTTMLREDIAFVIMNAGLRRMIIANTLYEHLQHVPLGFIIVGDHDTSHPSFDDVLKQGESADPVKPYSSSDTELAFLIYTSGTTGNPKGVMLSEKNILTNIEGFQDRLQFDPSDKMILALPLFHSYGMIVALAGLKHGTALTLIPKFQPRQILAALIGEEATLLPLVPTLFSVLLDLVTRKEGLTFPKLRCCVSGGASLPEALLKQIETALGTTIIEGYGMTETSPVIAVNDPIVGSIPGSVGKPLSNITVSILKSDGSHALSAKEEGEIVIKGDNVMAGYYNLPEETQAMFTQDGWLKTGDLGYLDAEGNLFISGRAKDLIIKAGENISPRPIEEALYAHPDIHEAAVIGLPHEKLGEEIVACVVLEEGKTLSKQAIVEHCRSTLNNTYVPDVIELCDELPKNPTGKIVKKALRTKLLQRAKA